MGKRYPEDLATRRLARCADSAVVSLEHAGLQLERGLSMQAWGHDVARLVVPQYGRIVAASRTGPSAANAVGSAATNESLVARLSGDFGDQTEPLRCKVVHVTAFSSR